MLHFTFGLVSFFSIESTCREVSLSKGQGQMSVKQTTLDTWSVSMAAKRSCFRSWEPIFSFLFSFPWASILFSSRLTWIIAVSPIVAQAPVSHPHLTFYPTVLSSTTPPNYKYIPYIISAYFISLIKVWLWLLVILRINSKPLNMLQTAVQDQPGLPLQLSLLSPTWPPPSSLNYSPLLKFTMFHVLTHTDP